MKIRVRWLLAALPSVALAADEPPVTYGLLYEADTVANVMGGIERNTVVLGKFKGTLDVDDRAIGIRGASVHLEAQIVHGPDLSGRFIGDAQTADNIDAPSALRPFQAWIELPLVRDTLWVKAGLIDLNAVFDIQTVGALFLNSSHGIGPDFSQTGANGPSIFPVTSGAVVARFQHDGWSAKLGAFDAVSGVPDRPGKVRIGYPGQRGLLAVAEVERALGKHRALKVGAWSYSTRFDALDRFDANGDAARVRGNRGVYATIEGRIGGSDARPFDAWLRGGVADATINPIAAYLGGGVAWGGEARRLGLGIARAWLGGPGKRALIAGGGVPRAAETAIELTYAHAVGDFLTIQPDVQFIVDPGWRSDIDDALVVGVRLTFSLR